MENPESVQPETASQPEAAAQPASTPRQLAPLPDVQLRMAAAASDDFATALENFTTESEEAAGEDHVIHGTVVKLTATHVVVDIGTKSEGMVPIAEVLDHEGKPKVPAGRCHRRHAGKGRDGRGVRQPLAPEGRAPARLG